MAIALNDILVRTDKCWKALLAQPSYLAFMRADLKAAVQRLAEAIEPSLSLLQHEGKEDDHVLAAAETTLEESRDMVMQLHDGVKYQYRHHAEQLRAVAPLNCGDGPAETGVRLATLARELPQRTPKFVWIPGDGLTLDALKKQIAAHGPAVTIEAQAGSVHREALKTLRDNRAAAHHLWDDDGLGLESWVIANIPKNEQYAFGRERRKMPRKKKTTSPDQKDPQNQGGTETTDESQAGADEATTDAPATEAEKKSA